MTHRLTRELKILAKEHKGNCTQCGYAFIEGDTAHLGYLQDGYPAYVCDGCADILSEIAVRNYFTSRPFDIPDYNAALWRYIDVSKYCAMLSTRGLYFTNASMFEDVWEGAKGSVGRKSQWDSFYFDFFRNAIESPPPGHTCELSEVEIEDQVYKILADLDESGRTAREITFINCWHESSHESDAMWKLYAVDTSQCLAIQTTYNHIYEALGRNPDIDIGRVRYIDFSQCFAPINGCFWYKRISLAHEQEVRAIVTSFYHRGKEGILIPVDLHVLVQAVRVSPSCPEWLMNTIQDVTNKFGLDIAVQRSDSMQRPFY